MGTGAWQWKQPRHGAPGMQLQRAQRQSRAESPPGRDSAWSIMTYVRPAGGGGRPPGRGEGRPGGGRPKSQSGRRTGRPRGGGSPRAAGGGEVEDPPPLQHNKDLSTPEGGCPSPQGKARICRYSPLRGHTCRCGRYMETYLTTTMGCTWQGESWRTSYVKVVGGN